jgi:predicted RNA-binding protein with RPS1 domain
LAESDQGTNSGTPPALAESDQDTTGGTPRATAESDQGANGGARPATAESDQGATGGTRPATAAPQRRPFVPREERDRRRREALESLTVGEWREGRVTSVVPFGAFVDLGGIDGLVHISQLGTGGYVEKAEDIVQPGQTVRVRVVEIDRDRQRIGLSMREPNAARPARPASTDRPPQSGGGYTPSAPTPDAGGSMGDGGDRGGNRRPDRGGNAPPGGRNRFQEPRGENRPRTGRRRDSEDTEDFRPVRGGAAQDYYTIFGDDDADEPAPTTAEELVARFNKGRH